MYKVYGELGEELYTGELYRDAYATAKEYVEWYDDEDGVVKSSWDDRGLVETVSGTYTNVCADIVLV